MARNFRTGRRSAAGRTNEGLLRPGSGKGRPEVAPPASVLPHVRPSSELILQRELHDAWIAGQRRDAPEGRGDPRRIRVTQLDPVQRIERLDASLDALSAAEQERSHEREVDDFLPRTVIGVADGAAVSAERGLCERGRVEPVVDCLVPVQIVQYLVRTLRAGLDARQRPVGSSAWCRSCTPPCRCCPAGTTAPTALRS